MTPEKTRFYELEGLRGVASLSVAFYHYFLAFYALAFVGPGSPLVHVQNMRFEDNLYGNPIMAFLSGTFAVAIFFVLSGFVLTIGFFQKGKIGIIHNLAIKRYPRLMLPALASVLICFTVMVLGLDHIKEAAEITQSGWLSLTWTFVPNLFEAIKGGVFGIFVESGNGYNNVLWTMYTEFLGSFVVFGFVALFGKSKYRWIVYTALMIFTFSSWLMAFVAGMVLADLYAHGYLKQKKRSIVFSIVILALGVFLGGYPFGTLDGTIYQFITIKSLAINWGVVYLSFGSIIVVGSILTVSQFANFFKLKALSILGKYTFSLYLVHLVILYVFTTFCFLQLRSVGLGFNPSALLSIAFSIPIVFLATYIFEKYIDAPSIKFSSYFSAVVMGKTKLPKKVRKYFKKSKKYLAAKFNPR